MGSNAENLYVLLGVAQTATDEEIRHAYKKKALKSHPDKNRDNVEAATAIFQSIVNAYDVLGDHAKRRQYDAIMHRQSGAFQQFRASKENPVKAAKTTKHTSSTNAESGAVPAVSVSDQTLESLVRAGALKSYTIKDMKVMLAARHLHVSGNKAVLIERLENFVNGVKQVKEPRAPPSQQQPKPPPQYQQRQQAPGGIPVGFLVRLHGLNANYYNGKMAVVKSFVNENGRQLIELLGKNVPPLMNQIYVYPGNMSVVRRIVVDDDSDDGDAYGLFHQTKQQQQQQQQYQQYQSQPQPQPQYQQYQPQPQYQQYQPQYQQHQPQAHYYQPQCRQQQQQRQEQQYKPQYPSQYQQQAQTGWV